MVVAAVRVLARTDVLHVHEHVAVLLRHGLLLGVELRPDVEALREEDERLPLGVEVGAERVQRLAERAGGRRVHRAGVVVLRHVRAEEEHDHVGLERARPLEVLFARPVLLEEGALDRAGHLEETALRVGTHGGDLLLEEVHVVLVARARGHAPVVRPADLRTRAVQRDRVAHEEDARPLLRGVERLLVLRVLPEGGHGVGLQVVSRPVRKATRANGGKSRHQPRQKALSKHSLFHVHSILSFGMRGKYTIFLRLTTPCTADWTCSPRSLVGPLLLLVFSYIFFNSAPCISLVLFS